MSPKLRKSPTGKLFGVENYDDGKYGVGSYDVGIIYHNVYRVMEV